jgi:hypothetical protein
MLPPLPPSPPSGPPAATNFSRWNATTPLPPNFDIVGVFVLQIGEREHQARQKVLHAVFVLARRGKGQGNPGVGFIDPRFDVLAENVVNGGLRKFDGGGDGRTDNV